MGNQPEKKQPAKKVIHYDTHTRTYGSSTKHNPNYHNQIIFEYFSALSS